jgi:hypothetical protein
MMEGRFVYFGKSVYVGIPLRGNPRARALTNDSGPPSAANLQPQAQEYNNASYR